MSGTNPTSDLRPAKSVSTLPIIMALEGDWRDEGHRWAIFPQIKQRRQESVYSSLSPRIHRDGRRVDICVAFCYRLGKWSNCGTRSGALYIPHDSIGNNLHHTHMERLERNPRKAEAKVLTISVLSS